MLPEIPTLAMYTMPQWSYYDGCWLPAGHLAAATVLRCLYAAGT
jgi:hypothetical protein